MKKLKRYLLYILIMLLLYQNLGYGKLFKSLANLVKSTISTGLKTIKAAAKGDFKGVMEGVMELQPTNLMSKGLGEIGGLIGGPTGSMITMGAGMAGAAGGGSAGMSLLSGLASGKSPLEVAKDAAMQSNPAIAAAMNLASGQSPAQVALNTAAVSSNPSLAQAIIPNPAMSRIPGAPIPPLIPTMPSPQAHSSNTYLPPAQQQVPYNQPSPMVYPPLSQVPVPQNPPMMMMGQGYANQGTLPSNVMNSGYSSTAMIQQNAQPQMVPAMIPSQIPPPMPMPIQGQKMAIEYPPAPPPSNVYNAYTSPPALPVPGGYPTSYGGNPVPPIPPPPYMNMNPSYINAPPYPRL